MNLPRVPGFDTVRIILRDLRRYLERVSQELERADSENLKRTGDIDFPHSFVARGTGPHAFGAAGTGHLQFSLDGAFTSDGSSGSGNAAALSVGTDLTLANGDTGVAALVRAGALTGASITTQGNSEVIPHVGTVVLDEPAITVGTGDTVTNAFTLRIVAAPTEGTNNYALWVDDGAVRIDQGVAMGGGAAPTLGTIGGSGPATAAQNEWIEIETQNGVRWVAAWA